MNELQNEDVKIATSSIGENFTDESHLDTHYQMAKAEYDACIEAVGIQSGWHVLDAGCGNGVFLRHLSQLAGRSGSVTAVDHAPEHIQKIENLAKNSNYLSPIQARVSDITKLPFEDNAFDCVWCANVSQYLLDSELDAALAEFKRVVRPGGIVAIKEFDLSCWHYPPIDVRLFWRLYDATAKANATQTLGTLRSSNMSRWLRKHGLDIKYRKTTFVERWAPVSGFEKQCSDMLCWLASSAQSVDLSEADKSEWRTIIETADSIVRDPDFCSREFFTLTIGAKSLA